MTVMGVLLMAAVIGGWFAQRRWAGYALAVSAVMPGTAGLVLAGQGLPIFYLMAVLFILETSVGRRPSSVGRSPLVSLWWFVGWAVAVSLIGPFLFDGLLVYSPQLSVDAQFGGGVPLIFGVSNLVQIGYLLLTALMLTASSRSDMKRRHLEVALWLGIAGAMVRMVWPRAWPVWLFDNLPGLTYPATDRNAGTFPEPSLLGLFAVGSLAYFIALLLTHHEPRTRARAVVGVAGSTVALASADSATAQVGIVAISVLAIIALLGRFLRGNYRMTPATFLVGIAAIGSSVFVAVSVGPAWFEAINEKTTSDSFLFRSTSDVHSLDVFLASGGVGVGLGSNRPSSLVAMLMSNVGIVGTVLFVVFAAQVVWMAWRSVPPVAWAMLGFLASASAGVPDLTIPILWLAVAVSLAEGPWAKTAAARPMSGKLSRKPIEGGGRR